MRRMGKMIICFPILITIYRDVREIKKENSNGFNRLNSQKDFICL